MVRLSNSSKRPRSGTPLTRSDELSTSAGAGGPSLPTVDRYGVCFPRKAGLYAQVETRKLQPPLKRVAVAQARSYSCGVAVLGMIEDLLFRATEKGKYSIRGTREREILDVLLTLKPELKLEEGLHALLMQQYLSVLGVGSRRYKKMDVLVLLDLFKPSRPCPAAIVLINERSGSSASSLSEDDDAKSVDSADEPAEEGNHWVVVDGIKKNEKDLFGYNVLVRDPDDAEKGVKHIPMMEFSAIMTGDAVVLDLHVRLK